MADDGWIECTVDDIKSSAPNAMSTGPFGSAISSQYFVDTGIPVIRGSNLSQDVGTRLIDDGLVFLTEEKAREFGRSVAKRGDLVFTCWGTIDQVGLIDGRSRFPEYVVSNKQMKLTPDPRKADSLFLYYLFSSPLMRERILNQGIGSSVPGFNLGQLKAINLRLPPVVEQHAIAHILGTLDDKIELNRRMNETLEAMARVIFKSWFIDFDPVRRNAARARNQTSPAASRHPLPLGEGRGEGSVDELLPSPRGRRAGNEGGIESLDALFPDRFEDSELGQIPAGWKAVTLPEVIEVNPPRSLKKSQSAPYLDMANMPTRGHSPDVVVERPFGSGMRFINGDTLVARITPCLANGKTAFVDFLEEGQVGWGSTEYIVLRPRPPLPNEFAYCLARSDEFRDFAIQSMTGSSGRQRVPAESLSHFMVAFPSEQIAEAFGKIVKPFFARVRAATEEGRTLAGLRDGLLPKLISGELRLKSSEDILEAAL